jgi:uncharacterized protein
MRGLRVLAALLTLICVAAGTNAEIAIPRSPAQWATDTTGFLKPQTVADLDARLRAYEAETGHQVLVYVTPTTGTTPTEDWTVRAFARWKVGRKGLDDGLILFVFPTDRKVRIEVGYGLEQTVPDATAARIIRNTITPKLRAGQPDEAVVAGVDQILAAISGAATGNGDVTSGKAGASDVSIPRPVARPTPADASSNGQSGEVFGEAIGIIIGVLVAIAIIWFVIWLAAKLPDPPATYVSSHDSGGWGLVGSILGSVVGGIASGGGGFSGGGGMSGGGGATGSW